MANPTDPLQLNLDSLKRVAKKQRKAGAGRLHECLDAQAKSQGYASWPALVNAHDKALEVRHG